MGLTIKIPRRGYASFRLRVQALVQVVLKRPGFVMVKGKHSEMCAGDIGRSQRARPAIETVKPTTGGG